MQRFLLNFAVILLFALVQIGVATHQISHFSQAKHHQQDQNNLDDACGQCIGFAQVAGGLTPTEFSFVAPQTQSLKLTLIALFLVALTRFSQLARAPPALKK